MAKYPVFLDLKGRRAVVIGAGHVAVRKVQALSDAGARVVVIAPAVDPAFEQICGKGDIELVISTYSKDYLVEATIAIAATNDLKLNRRVYEDCQELEVLCNVVDQPELCDFYIPAVVQRGSLQIAIGTDGKCPAYAGHIRKKLEDMFTEAHGRFLTELETVRKQIITEIADPAERKALLGELVKDESLDYFIKNGSDAWRKRAANMISG